MNYSAISPAELVRLCVDTRDGEAWAEFIRRFHKLIATVVLRTARRWGGASPQAIDDLVQETYLKLCADDAQLLRSFEAQHADAIFGYIKVVTANLVHDHFKKLASQKRGGALETSSLEPNEGSRVADGCVGTQQVERGVLIEEIRCALQSTLTGDHAARDQRIFWLYYRVGLSASAIATLPAMGLTTKGVESTLVRLTRMVREKLVGLVEKRSHVGFDTKGVRASDSFS